MWNILLRSFLIWWNVRAINVQSFAVILYQERILLIQEIVAIDVEKYNPGFI
jgi:hypothetical protein